VALPLKAAHQRAKDAGPALRWTLEASQGLLLATISGTCLGYLVEGWGLLDSVYFAVISILTVGYGDFSPSSSFGRALCTVFLPFACAAALRSISVLGSVISNVDRTAPLNR